MPTPRLHTIVLHGGHGNKVAKQNVKVALGHYSKVLANRIKCIEAETAKGVYEWQVPPGNRAKDENHPKWSGAFRANWQVKIGGDFESGWQSNVAPERYPWTGDNHTGGIGGENRNLYSHLVDTEKANKILDGEDWKNASIKDAIHIGNVAPYAKWLNYGGSSVAYGLDGTFLPYTPGYFFLELCTEYIKLNADIFIRKGLEIANTKPAKGE